MLFGKNVVLEKEEKIEKLENKKTEKVVDVSEMYTTLPEAKEEIWRRWNDKDLRKKVEDYLGEIPEPFKKEPRAVLSRNIITPNLELIYFLDLVKNTNLSPLGLEGVSDKFCTKNYDKVSLGKLTFFRNKEFKNIENGKTNVAIIDMMSSEGERFCDVKTFWGEGLVDFHHKLLKTYNVELDIFDDFNWFSYDKKKDSISEYYKKFFAFFICHGILFENFIVKGNEKEFTNGVVIDSFNEIKEIFGVSPLIIPLLPMADDDHWYFRSYIKK